MSSAVVDLIAGSDEEQEQGGATGAPDNVKKRGRGRPRKTPRQVMFSAVDGAAFTSTATDIYFEVAGKPEAKKRAAYGRKKQ